MLTDYIKCGDCLELMKELPDKSIDLIVTDPPYKTITGGKNNGKNSKRPKGILCNNKRLFKYQLGINISDWMPQLYRVLKDNTHCYIFSNALNIKEMIIEAEKVGFKLHNILVWEKNNCVPSQWYMKNCEYVLFLRKGKAKYINNISSKTVHFCKNVTKKKHPTEKPAELFEMYILNSSNKGDIVFDPFAGVGTLAVAAMSTDRRFICHEIDSEFYNIALERISREKEVLC